MQVKQIRIRHLIKMQNGCKVESVNQLSSVQVQMSFEQCIT